MATGTVPVTPGSGQNIAIDTNSNLAGGAAVQIMSLANSDGSRLANDPDGTLQVSSEASGVFLEDFAAYAITTQNTVSAANGGTTPSASGGNAIINAGTASGGYAYVRSISTFFLRAGSYLRFAHIIQTETGQTANSVRWWGSANIGASSTAASPVYSGTIFQYNSSTGALEAATYNAGTKTLIATLTKPSDGLYHRYEIWVRQSVTYWLIDGLIVATKTFPQPGLATALPISVGSVNAAAITAPTFNVSGMTVADHSGTNHSISDGQFPDRQATVKYLNQAVAASDFPLAVGLHPSSPLPAGTNALGALTIGTSTTLIGPGYVTSAGTNANLIRTSNTRIFELTFSNPTTSAMYLKLYNMSTAPTVGTSVPVLTIRIAASGNAGDFVSLNFGPNGKVFTIGFAFAVTGAAAASDTTATVAGGQLHYTYS